MDEGGRQNKEQFRKNIGGFLDPEMLADLEPLLHKHFIGPPKTAKGGSENGTNLKLKIEKRTIPPPLPQTSSSSDVYTKKIASFKKKLKTFKGISNPAQDNGIRNKIVVHIPENIQKKNSTFGSNTNSTLKSNLHKNLETNDSKSTNFCSKLDFSYNHSETKLSYNSNDNNKDANGTGKAKDNNNTMNLKNSVPINSYEFSNESPLSLRTSPKISRSFGIDSFETSSPTLSIFNAGSSDLHMPVRKLAKENKCSICDLKLDTLYNVQDNERIVELRCGHMTHEECLVMELELNLSVDQAVLNDKSTIIEHLPLCPLCPSHLNTKTIPKDDNLLTQMFTRLITSTFKNSSKNHLLNSTTLTMPTPLTPKFPDSFKFDETDPSTSSFYPSLHQSTIDKIVKEENIDTRNILSCLNGDNYGIISSVPDRNVENDNESINKLKPLKSSFYKKHSKKPSRGSFVSGTSAIVSSVRNETPTNETYGSWNGKFPNNLIKQEFIDDLITLSTKGIIKDYEDSDFMLTNEFIKSLGKFRIVDKFNLLDSHSKSELNITENYCFLFDHMLLMFNLFDYKFKLISISLSTFIDISEPGCLILKASKNAELFYKLIFNSNELEMKWRGALTDMKQHIDNDLVTSTLKSNEFDDIIESELSDSRTDIETIGTLQSYIGEDGYRRLPTGVCPRFYEGTINSLVFKEKPTNAIIVLNQTNYIPSSVTAIKNIFKSLSMIGINIKLILCSTSTLSMKSKVLDNCELNKNESQKINDLFMSKIDVYQEKLEERDFSNMKEDTVIEIMNDYIGACNNKDRVTTMIISNSSLKDISSLQTATSLLVEIGLDARKKSNREDVADLASWDDIMEVICVYCGLEFDESDFYHSSDNDDDDDDDHEDSYVSHSDHIRNKF